MPKGDHGPGEGRVRVLDRTLLYISISATANYLAFGIITVMLPRVVKDDLGAGDFAVGAIVGCFAVSAMVARPFAGKYGNVLGRRALMLVGGTLIGVSFFFYGLAPVIAVLVVLRLMSGVGEALYYTGAATMVADHAPPEHRATAIGYYSVAIYVGTGVGPALGEALHNWLGVAGACIVAGVLAALSALLSLALPERRILERPHERQPWLNRNALLPGSVLALGVMGQVAFQAYVPLYTEELEMSSAYVFLLYSSVMITIRAFARPVHRMEPRRAAFGAMLFIAAGMATMSSTASPVTLYAGTALLSAGFAAQFPALMTMAVNRATEQERSSAVGTYTAFMNLSIGIGGFLLAVPAEVFGYRASFACGSVTALLGILLLRTSGARIRPAVLSTSATSA